MEVIVSAPGKVLMTGGYLILERPNAGLVLSTTARFYAMIKPLYEEVKPESWAWAWADVKLTSPQLSREATYKLSIKKSTLHCTSSRESSNPFVEQAVQYVIAAATVILGDNNKENAFHKLLLQGLDITILGCNDFYSYRNQIEAAKLPLNPESLASIPPFSAINFNFGGSNDDFKPEVAKTGLGSSAAMTTAVVAALFQYLGVIHLETSGDNCYSDLDLVHLVAQSAHCIAQGKVGSGFDVSAAVYGSQRYTRFSPEVIYSAQATIKGTSLQEVINNILEGKWDHERKKFSLPPLITLLLGEPGIGGSSTISLVGAVKKWQRADPLSSQELWKRLADSNFKLEKELKMLSEYAVKKWDMYKSIIIQCSQQIFEKWSEQAVNQLSMEIVKSLLGARDAFLEIRSCMQQMGKAAGVPIEPDSQTHLLDATMNMEGVLLAGVPGAGGFDAIFALTLGESDRKITEAWSSLGVLPLLVREEPRGISLESSDPRTIGISSAISSLRLQSQ